MFLVIEVIFVKFCEIVCYECCIELVMEGICYWDIMRWGIVYEVLFQKIWGVFYLGLIQYVIMIKEVDLIGNYCWYVGKCVFCNLMDYIWLIFQFE